MDKQTANAIVVRCWNGATDPRFRVACRALGLDVGQVDRCRRAVRQVTKGRDPLVILTPCNGKCRRG